MSDDYLRKYAHQQMQRISESDIGNKVLYEMSYPAAVSGKSIMMEIGTATGFRDSQWSTYKWSELGDLHHILEPVNLLSTYRAGNRIFSFQPDGDIWGITGL